MTIHRSIPSDLFSLYAIVSQLAGGVEAQVGSMGGEYSQVHVNAPTSY